MEELNLDDIRKTETKKHGHFIEKALHKDAKKPEQNKASPQQKTYPKDDFRTICRKVLGKEYTKLTVTDKNRKKRPNEPFYIFTVEYNEFIYTKYDQDNRRVIKYDCKQEALFINDKKQPAEKIDSFVKQINKIGKQMMDDDVDAYGVERDPGF